MSGRRVTPVLEALALALLGLGVRALPLRSLLVGDRVHFFGNDAYYHARRVVHALGDFSQVLQRDAYLNYPHGGEPIWSPLFDAAAAAAVRLLGAQTDLAQTEWVLVWIAPVLGAATVACVYSIAHGTLGRGAARVSAGVLALLPAHFAYTRIGYLDHHAAVSLMGALLLLGLVGFAVAVAGPTPRPRSALALGVGLGLGMALALLLWPGMLLEVAMLEAGFAAVWITRSQLREGRRVAAALALAHGLAAASMAPFALGREWEVWGSFSPVVLSTFQPWLLGSGAVFWAGLAWAPGIGAAPGFGRRLALAGGVAFAVGAGALLVAGDPAGSAGQAWAWLAKQERFQASVAESRPLLWVRGRFAPGFAWTQLTGAFFALPFLWRLAWRAAGGEQRRIALRVWIGWSAVLAVVTLAQTRFLVSLAVGLALLVGFAAVELGPRLRSRGPLVWLGAALAAAAVFGPSLISYGPPLRNQLRAARGLPPELAPAQQRHRLLLELAHWIRTHTEPTSGWLDPTVRPEYAVLSRWTDGHVLEYVARRPSVATNFGDDVGGQNFRLSEAYYAAREPRASEILEEVGARYVVVEYRSTLGPAGPESMAARLYFHDGEAGESSVAWNGTGVSRVAGEFPAVSRHRLVHETPSKAYSPSDRPAFKLYEHVNGAVLEGETEPASAVVAQIEVVTNLGRRFTFRSSTRSDAKGRYRLRFPYATNSGAAVGGGVAPERSDVSGVRTEAQVLVSSRSRSRAVRVDEAQVREGLAVAVPSLRSGVAP